MSKRTKIIIAGLLVVFLAVLLFFVLRDSGASEDRPDAVEVPCVEVDGNETEGCGWLELPSDCAEGEYVVTHRAQMGGMLQRNYTVCYDVDRYAAIWVAYPLCSDHMSTGREEDWGYGASVPTVNYPKNFYARGHQLPNADRSAVPDMMAQTYYSTNMTPQIQNGFNGAIWAKLEEAVRGSVPAGDTLYVATGAVFCRAGHEDEVRTMVNRNDSKVLPVPNFYWKALLKVRRNDGVVTAARTVGFWLPHDDLKGHSYSEYAVSVDQIEQWTGLDCFASLPDGVEKRLRRTPAGKVSRLFNSL